MPTFFEHAAARIAQIHARRVYARFERALRDVAAEQARVLHRVLPLVAESDFGRRYGLGAIRSLADLRRAVPLQTYEDYRATIDRVCDGDTQALFSPGQRLVMFATSSGTTAQPKRVPVTSAFVADYRRGWNTFGLKMLTDHPRAILRAILQSSGRYDAGATRSGVPYGAITGLLARTQKRIVRRFYVGRPEIAALDSAEARYYTLMRLGIVRDVAFAITANPATLIQMARTADEHAEALIRDVRDGTLSTAIVSDTVVRSVRLVELRPQPERARALERLCAQHGALRPRDYWQLDFLACWTGGSMGHYLQRLADWWGPLPVRDVGLLASEGRVSIPLDDNTPAGVLDITSAVFEFIPAEHAEDTEPITVGPSEVEIGRDYAVVLTNTTGLLRYRLDDVVRVRGWLQQAPVVEFLYRCGRVASVAGEKLTENQVVAAVGATCRALRISEFDFLLAPCWGDPPFYRLSAPRAPNASLAATLDESLAQHNEEYASRRKSLRLGPLQMRTVPPDAISAMDRHLTTARRTAAEQYKRPCLMTSPGDDDRLLAMPTSAAPPIGGQPAAK